MKRFILDSRQAKEIDERLQVKFLLSVLVLMENAGSAIKDELLKYLKPKDKVVFICGKGNNAGDGFVACRHLLGLGFKPEVFVVGKTSDVKGEAKTNLEILARFKQKIHEINQNNLSFLKKRISASSCIVDALFGTGLKNNICGIALDVVRLINDSGKFVLSVDIPSGLNGTTGEIMGISVFADRTVTFMARKRGMLTKNGRVCCGKVIVKDIGFPFKLARRKLWL